MRRQPHQQPARAARAGTVRRSLAAGFVLTLALLLPLPGLAATEHVVRSGETLSEIAERYKVSLQRLMQLNGLQDADLVETGTRLKLPGGAAPSGGGTASGRASYIVKPGDTLSEIAERSGISVQRLMQLNGLQDADRVETGQRLVVPGGPAATAATTTSDKTARQHLVKPGETLSGIADRYAIPISRLISLNQLKEPDNLQAGTRLTLRGTAPKPAAASKPAPAKPAAQPAAARPSPAPNPPVQAAAQPVAQAPAAAVAKPVAATPAAPQPAVAAKPTAAPAAPDWRSYGPLQVDFSNLQPMGGSQVAAALNGNGQAIFVAVNCAATKLNTTGEAGGWKAWEAPKADFEEALVKDVCKQAGT